jgi:hypothetical protein
MIKKTVPSDSLSNSSCSPRPKEAFIPFLAIQIYLTTGD